MGKKIKITESDLTRIVKKTINESQLLNERYTCWHRKGGMIGTQLHSCGRHTCGTGDWNIPGHRNEYGSRFECNGRPGERPSGIEVNDKMEYNPTINYRKGGSPKSKYWKLPKWLSEDIDKRVMVERSSTMLNEEPICGDRNGEPCESRSCPKSVGATWRPTYVTNSCNCKAPGGGHCHSVAPDTGHIDLEYGNEDIWVGTEYEDLDIMAKTTGGCHCARHNGNQEDGYTIGVNRCLEWSSGCGGSSGKPSPLSENRQYR